MAISFLGGGLSPLFVNDKPTQQKRNHHTHEHPQ
jgi:hypothetical protein